MKKQDNSVCCDCGCGKILILKSVETTKGGKIRIVQVFRCRKCGNQWEKEKHIKGQDE